MSIDTYDTLAIDLAGAPADYDRDCIERLTREIAASTGAAVERKRNTQGVPFVSVTRARVEMQIYYDTEPYFAEESDEMAAEPGLPCRGNTRRFNPDGTDLDLVLIHDHRQVCERLNVTGDFVVYLRQAGLLFDPPA